MTVRLHRHDQGACFQADPLDSRTLTLPGRLSPAAERLRSTFQKGRVGLDRWRVPSAQAFECVQVLITKDPAASDLSLHRAPSPREELHLVPNPCNKPDLSSG